MNTKSIIRNFLFFLCWTIIVVLPWNDRAFAGAELVQLTEVVSAIYDTGAGWVAGETEVSMMPVEEIEVMLGVLPEPDELSVDEIAVGGALRAPLPAVVDWRNRNGKNYVTEVKNQGQCGSCVFFAIGGALEAKTLITYNMPDSNVDLSEQIILSCGGHGSCQTGAVVSYVAEIASQMGTGVEECYPYTTSNGTCTNACQDWGSHAYEFNSYTVLSYYPNSTTVDRIKNALHTTGPVAAAFSVYDDFLYYRSGVYKYTFGSLRGGHAILVVGYNDNEKAFIVKNSWGKNWGANGYFKIAYSEVLGQTSFGRSAISFGNAVAPDFDDPDAPLVAEPVNMTMAVGAEIALSISGGVKPYTISSSDETVASTTFGIDGAIVTGLEQGEAVLTVTDKNLASVTVEVMVEESLSVDQQEVTISGSEEAFVTVSGGRKPYVVDVGDGTVVDSILLDGLITIWGVSQGQETVTVTDQDQKTVSFLAMVSFPLSVQPEAVDLRQGVSSIIRIRNGVSPYSVVSSDESVVTVEVNENRLIIKALPAPGFRQALVTVTDSNDDSAVVNVTIDPYSDVDGLFIEEFGQGFSFEFDQTYDAGYGTLVFQVRDQNDQPVNGLSTGNFVFRQDNGEADIESFSDVTEETILNISLVLDASYSLYQDGHVEKLKEAANLLVDRLGDNTDLKYYRFANRVSEINSVDELSFNEVDRFTSLYDAVYEAINDISHGFEKRILVVFTDGADNHSVNSMAMLTPLIEKHDVVIYTIGLGNVDEEDLQSMSVNGEMVLADSGDRLMDTFDIIADYLKSIYTLRFWTPSRTGIHELGFNVNANNTQSNIISTMFQASESVFSAMPNGIISPVLQVVANGTEVKVSWNDVEGADGYTLYYSPPDLDYVHKIEMGKQTNIEVDLWHGFKYLVAVQPYNGNSDVGGLSNIVLVEIK